MAEIKKLTDGSGSQYFPQTHTKAVVDDYGNSVESVMAQQLDALQNAFVEADQPAPDIYPTKGSGNWVTSGGVYSATHKIKEMTTTSTDGYGIGTNGNTVTASSLGYTLFVSLDGCAALEVKQPTLGVSWYGIAFYNSNQSKLSFSAFTDTGTEAYIWKTYDIPDNAVYARWTVYASTNTGNYYEPAYRKVMKVVDMVDGFLEKKDTILLVPAMNAASSGTLFTSIEVPQGTTIFYDFTTTSTAAYIIIHKSDDTTSYLGKTSSSSGGTAYNGSYTLPSNFTYAEIGAASGGSLTINRIYCDKISKTKVANNTTTTEAGYALDARQGGLLKDMIINGINLSAFITSPYNGWRSYYTATLNADAQYGTNSTFLQTDKDIYIKADNGYQLSAIYLSGGKACGVDANGNMLSSGVVAYYDSIIVKAGHQWNVQARTNPLSNITDLAEFFSHFKVSYNEESLGEEMKEANPYFQTFESNGSLTKEVIFSTDVDSGGGEVRRIPSVIITNDSTVIAAAEVRSAMADNAQTGIILARKTSDANSWTYNFVLPYNAESYGKVMNPCFVVDRSGAHGTTGRIYLFFIAFQITSNNNGYAYLCTSSEIDNMYVYSDDDGVTWSSPASTKSAWDTSKYTWMCVSPANGALMSDGTFVLPCMARSNNNWYSGVMYKTPSGSWTYSNKTSAAGDNESTVFVYDGKAYLNCRNESNGHTRTLYKLDMTSNEMVKVDYNYDPNLICQQSICNGTIGGNSTFFQTSNDPLTYNTRNRLTVWASKNGMKWTRLIRVNDGTTYGYSVADCYDGKLVMVYENSGTISCIDLSSMATTIGTVYSKVLGKPLEDRLHELIEKLLAE